MNAGIRERSRAVPKPEPANMANYSRRRRAAPEVRASEPAETEERIPDSKLQIPETGKSATRNPQSTIAERFVMCPPTYLSTRIPNNVFMERGGDQFHGGTKEIDRGRAMTQYARIVRLLKALDVSVLEIPPVPEAQDQTYTANVAVALEPYIVLANYKAPGRDVEEEPARQFFESLGYEVIQPPSKFEGEADFKKWKTGTYFGGFGKFTDAETLDWIEEQTGVEVIPIREVSDELYHLDCSLFVIDEENFLVNRAGMDGASFKQLDKLGNIVEVPKELNATGITNAVKAPGNKKILISGMFHPEDKKYQRSMEWINETFDKFEYTVLFVDIDEPDKSGADVSCMVMKLDF